MANSAGGGEDSSQRQAALEKSRRQAFSVHARAEERERRSNSIFFSFLSQTPYSINSASSPAPAHFHQQTCVRARSYIYGHKLVFHRTTQINYLHPFLVALFSSPKQHTNFLYFSSTRISLLYLNLDTYKFTQI
jgi:hypothetical protein